MSETLPAFEQLPPRLRGWLHVWTFVVAVAACGALVAVASAVSGQAMAATAIYGATVLGVFGVSALYHRRTWPSMASRQLMQRLDHAMIFLFIAGTYTAAAVLAMSPTTAAIVLVVVWGGALAGVIMKLCWPGAPGWLGVPIYLLLGWVAVLVLPDLAAHSGLAALVLLLLGGALYTLGAVGYAVRRPRGWPATFGFHEFFHLATVLAAASQHVAIWLVLLR